MVEALKYERLRQAMVKRQIESRGVKDPLTLAAMHQVPRHLFVGEALMDQAYGDYPLPIGEGQTISQPYIVAEMTQALALTGQERVLEIGTGSGYQAAVISRIAQRIYTIERHHALYIQTRRLFDRLRYFNIVTRYSDGTLGWAEESPFDAIIVTAGAPRIPQRLLDQLAEGGRMVIPVGDRHVQDLVKIEKSAQGIKKTSLGGCRFVKLVGKQGWDQ